MDKKQWIRFVVFLLIIASYFIVKWDEKSNTVESVNINTINAVEINKGHEFVQEMQLLPEQGTLVFLGIYITTYNRINHSTLYVDMYKGDDKIDSWAIECKQLADNRYVQFQTHNRIEAGLYRIVLTSDAEEGEGVGIGITNAGKEFNSILIDGEPSIDSTMIYQTKCRQNVWINYNIVGLIIIVLIMTVLLLFMERYSVPKLSCDKLFLLIWIIVSLAFVISNPLFNIPDEYNHFYRAYEISEGHLLSDFDDNTNSGGRELPFDEDLTRLSGTWENFESNKGMVLTENRVFKSFSNTSLYAPLSYFPQAIGIYLARHLTRNVAVIAYTGRFVNWICITFLLFLALRIIPFGKELLMFVALLPMNVHEAVSLAPDGMVVALSIMIIAYVLRLRYCQECRMSIIQIVIVYALGIAISMYKIVYLPFCLLFILIPNTKIGGMKGKAIHGFLFVLMVACLSLLWLKSSGQFLTHPGANKALQLDYVISNPLNFVIVFLRTIFEKTHILLMQMTGSHLANLNIITIGFIALMVLYYLFKKANLSIIYADYAESRLCFTIVAVTVFLLTGIGLYIQWTAVYASQIDGLQGRYFIPLIMPIVFAFSKTIYDDHADEDNIHGSVLILTLANVCACISMLFDTL